MRVVTTNEIVEQYYPWAIQCLKGHTEDISEYHGDLCLYLYKLASAHPDENLVFFHTRIHLEVHNLISKHNKLYQKEEPQGLCIQHNFSTPLRTVEFLTDFDTYVDYLKLYSKPGVACRVDAIADILLQGGSQQDVCEMLGLSRSVVSNYMYRIARQFSIGAMREYGKEIW